MAKSRKDSKGRALKPGEHERNNGKGYEYRYVDRITGKRCSISATTLEELRNRKDEVLRNQFDGIHDNRTVTLNDYYGKWKNLKVGLKPNTKSNYIYMYEKFVYSKLGMRPLKDLMFTDVVGFYTYLVNTRKVSVSTIDTLHNVIHPALQMAVNDNVIRRNVADGTMKDLKARENHKQRALQEQGLKPKSLTLDEQYRLLDVIKGTVWEPLLKFMILTGVRIGELGALTWDDIDETKGVIHIRKNLVYYDDRMDNEGCRFRMNTTKSGAGFRDLPLNDDIQEILTLQRKIGVPSVTKVDWYENFIFTTRFGTPVKQDTVNRALKRIQRDANSDPNAKVMLPAMTCHKMRKTYATNCVRQGIDVATLMKSMGHTDSKVTLEYYAEAQMDMQIEADRKMREGLKAEMAKRSAERNVFDDRDAS